MNTPLDPSFPPVSDLSTLKPGDKVWILLETFKPRLWVPAQRYFAGSVISGTALLSLDSSTFQPIMHHGPIWTKRAGALEELLEMARRHAATANAEVDRLESLMACCAD